MRDRPAYLPLYVRDFLSDQKVLSLTWEQQAIHLRLLMASWEAGGPLPYDLPVLARMIGWQGDPAHVEAVLVLCWEKTNGLVESRRLEHERNRTQRFLRECSENGKKGNAIRWRSGGDREAIGLASHSQAQAQDGSGTSGLLPERGGIPSPRRVEVQETPKPPADAGPPRGSPRKRVNLWEGEIPIPLQSTRFRDLWQTWLAYRRDEKRKPVTQLSGDQALRQLQEMGLDRACKAIEHTIAMGWQGIREPEAPRLNGNGNGKHIDYDEDQRRTLRTLGML